MAKKIILFLSSLPEGAPLRESTYNCKDQKGNRFTVRGRISSEAPLLYLKHCYPDAEEAICILTPSAKKTSWEPIQAYVGQALADAKLPPLRFSPIELQEKESFYQRPLREIQKLLAPGDQILLETTGGFRNTVMDLLLLSRILSYSGYETLDAVYSNFPTHEVQSVLHLIELFDLVGGMQELSSFGSIRTLQTYYNHHQDLQDEKVGHLLYTMRKLSDKITLCRTGGLEATIEDFNQALEAAADCTDPLMQALIPAFQEKFDKRMTTPGLIKWCAESDMIQQALTIYKERIPRYVLSDPNIQVSLREEVRQDADSYKDVYEDRLWCALYEMGDRAWSKYSRKPQYQKLYGDPTGRYVIMLDHLAEFLPDSAFSVSCNEEDLRAFIMDYYYVRALRNMVNHANDELTQGSALMHYIANHLHYKQPEDAKPEDIRTILVKKCVEHLKKLHDKARR